MPGRVLLTVTEAACAAQQMSFCECHKATAGIYQVATGRIDRRRMGLCGSGGVTMGRRLALLGVVTSNGFLALAFGAILSYSLQLVLLPIIMVATHQADNGATNSVFAPIRETKCSC